MTSPPSDVVEEVQRSVASSRKRDHRLPLLAALVKIVAYYVENGNISSAFREENDIDKQKNRSGNSAAVFLSTVNYCWAWASTLPNV